MGMSTPSDRMALALCREVTDSDIGCPLHQICNDCRLQSAAVAHEIAQILRERHGGSSTTADWLDGVGGGQP